MNLKRNNENGKKIDDQLIKNAFKSKSRNISRDMKNNNKIKLSQNKDTSNNIFKSKLEALDKKKNYFKNVIEVHEWAFPKYKKWINSLNDYEYTAIFKYCFGSFDKTVNLAYKNDKIDELPNKEKLMVKAIESALERAYVPEDLVVYRGKRGNTFLEIFNLKKDEMIGKTIIEKGFMSTSLLEKVAKKHEQGIMLKINVPKGSKGAYVGTISEHLEAEMLFGLNQELIIKRVDEKENVIVIECDLKQDDDSISESHSTYSISDAETVNDNISKRNLKKSTNDFKINKY